MDLARVIQELTKVDAFVTAIEARKAVLQA